MRVLVLISCAWLLTTMAPFTFAQQNQQDFSYSLTYQSAFEGFKSYQDPTLSDWYQANQTVKEIGGWRTYMQEPYQGNQQQNNQEKTNATGMPPMQHHHHGGAQ